MDAEAIELIIMSILTSIGSTLLIKHLDKKYVKRTIIGARTNEVVLEYKIAKIFYYLYLVLFVLFCIFIAVTTTIDLKGILIIFIIAIFFMTLFVLIWGNKIIYDGNKIIKIRFWFKRIEEKLQDIDKIYVTYGQSLIIKFYDGIRIKVSYHHTSRQYVEYDLKEKVSDYKWTRAGKKNKTRS